MAIFKLSSKMCVYICVVEISEWPSILHGTQSAHFAIDLRKRAEYTGEIFFSSRPAPLKIALITKILASKTLIFS